jgi:carboxyl-terminal processing protease
MKRIGVRLLALLLVSLSGIATAADDPLEPLTSAYLRAAKPGEQVETYRALFGTVMQRVQRSYPQEVDVPSLVAAAVKTLEPLTPESGEPAAIFKTAVNAALASLDPHSRYLDPREQRDQQSSASGSFGGLGMQVDLSDGLVRIVAPMEGTPAARAGLKSGDLIVRFDDQNVLGMTLADAISKMRGDPGTPITLVIRRPGREDDFSVPLVREEIRSETLRSSMEGDVLVLKLSGFTRSVGSMLDKAVADASLKATPRAVVLDMRGNPGGLLNQAVTVADTFLGHGEIVSLRGRTAGNRRSWQADPAERLAGLPMVVLIDGRSASAAELVAAALQENGRALVMGQRSYGKGSVQSIVSLGSEKGALRLTTALYHGPSGRTVQRTGVGPDIELMSEPVAGARAARRLSNGLPGADEPPPPKAQVEQARCAPPKTGSDQGLACALAFIKAGSVDAFVASVGGRSEL